MRWYVSQRGKASGPLSEERLGMLVRWGKISRGAYICDEQSSCWVPITRSRFAPLLAAPPAAVPRPSMAAGAGRFRGDPSAAARVWNTQQQRLALAIVLLLSAAAFMLTLHLAPARAKNASSLVPGPARALSVARFGGARR